MHVPSNSQDTQPLRIAWLVRGDEGYGVRRAVLSLIEGVRAQGHEVMVLCLSDETLASPCRALGAQVRPLSMAAPPALKGGVLDKWRGARALRRYETATREHVIAALRESRVDALHVLWPNLVGLAGAVSDELGVPCMWEMPNVVGANMPMRVSRWYYQWLCWRRGVTVLANSAYTAEHLGRWPVRPHVFHLGVSAARFDPQRVEALARSQLGIPPSAVVLGIFARLTPSKGQDRVLRALLALIEEGHDLHLLLLGGAVDTEYAHALRALAEAHGAGHRLHHVTEVSDPQRYFAAIDVAINSRVDAEPFGLSVVEAMMMARPVAVHARGGPAETVIDSETGWHVTDPSVAGWTAALRRVVAERPRWPGMGEAARRRAMTHFTIEAQAQRYLSILERVRGASVRSSRTAP